MIQLSVLLLVVSSFFAFVGFTRGLNKEIISTAGIVLGLFGLHQFDNVIRGTLLANLPPDQKFYIQSILFLLVAFFSYQTRALVGSEATRARAGASPEGRDTLQSSVLGGIVGFINGYLIFGTLWYFLDINRVPNLNEYPLAPYVIAPFAGSSSAAVVPSLPLYVLAGGPGGNGDFLALAVIGLFLFVLVVI